MIFVATRRGNAFMNELLDAIAVEVADLGVRTEMSYDSFPDVAGAVYVVIPHEFFATTPRVRHPSGAQLTRTISFCVEQPGTAWFETSLLHARRSASAVEISGFGLRELRRRGVAAERFQIGYTSHWDVWGGARTSRSVDVLHLGTETPRRLEALAGHACELWRRETRILVPTVSPKTKGADDFLMGSAKWRALAESKILLNMHRDHLPYFEWVRVIEAMCNGCVVVSEASADAAPLVSGRHFVSGRLSSLGILAERLLDDEATLDLMRRETYSYLKCTLPMRSSAALLAELATDVAAGGRRRRHRPRVTTIARPARRMTYHGAHRIARVARSFSGGTSGEGVAAELRQTRAIQKRLLLQQIELARAVARLERRIAGNGASDVFEVARTPAYDDAEPRVSVIVPLYNHAQDVGCTLASVASSLYDALEVVVLDDGSTDDSRRTAVQFFERHTALPALVLAHHSNRGLGTTRNALLQAARGELVLPLDADNELYPTAVERLVATLDDHPDAAFAYPILAVHTRGRPVGLLSYQPWDTARLVRGNYIDALSLLRRERAIELGGYTQDIRLFGWEDYDLWCRLATSGDFGLHVPQILAAYSRSGHSMLTVTNLDDSEAIALLHSRYPSLFQGGARRRVTHRAQ
jgi:hypothetical protein